MKHFVYAIGRENEVARFGASRNPSKSLTAVRAECPVDLFVLSAMAVSTRAIAKEIFSLICDALRRHRMGDWFQWHQDTGQVVTRLRAHDPRQFRPYLLHLAKQDYDPKGYYVSQVAVPEIIARRRFQ